jgi:hypothetical protein
LITEIQVFIRLPPKNAGIDTGSSEHKRNAGTDTGSSEIKSQKERNGNDHSSKLITEIQVFIRLTPEMPVLIPAVRNTKHQDEVAKMPVVVPALSEMCPPSKA